MKKKILLIGTESSGLTYMRMLLERDGYSVSLLRDLRRAESTIVEQRPSLIIIDDQADDLQAIQICRDLTNNVAITPIRVILLLPFTEGDVIQTTRETCGVEVLTKPLLPHLLSDTVGQLMANGVVEKKSEMGTGSTRY